MNWYLTVLKRYTVFTGRAARTEFWMFALFNLIVSIVLGVVDSVLGLGTLLAGLYSLAVLLPSIGVGIRRLHDTGRSGWWLLISFVPLVGLIVLLVFTIQDSQPGDNQYGPNPKGALPV
jgi:uncharacterized membrane protein YhaH (DUF805 family)